MTGSEPGKWRNAWLSGQGSGKERVIRLETRRSVESHVDEHMGVGTTCKYYSITAQCPQDSIHHRRNTKQPNR